MYHTWLRWVFSVVKHQYIAGRCLRGNYTRILWHISSSVHLSFMVDLNLYLDLPTHRAKTSELCRHRDNVFNIYIGRITCVQWTP